MLNKKQRTYPFFLDTVCVYTHDLFLSLELPLLHQGQNNQSEVEVIQLSFIAVAPLLAAALALWLLCGSADKMFWDLAKADCKQHFKQNCSYSYDIDPSLAPLPKSQVLMPVAVGPGANAFCSFLWPGKPSQGS